MPSIKETILEGFTNIERNDLSVHTVVMNASHLSEVRREISNCFDPEIRREELEKGNFGTLYGANVIIDNSEDKVIFLTISEVLKRQEKLLKKKNRKTTQQKSLINKIETVNKLKFIGR